MDIRNYGWLITNEFLHTTKFTELNDWLTEAAAKKDIELEIFTNAQILVDYGRKTCWDRIPDFVLFQDKDIRLARYLESTGLVLYNNSRAIDICDDKTYTQQILWNSGVVMPRTIVAPMTFQNIGYKNMDFLDTIIDKIGFPMVVKECYGSFGQQVFLTETKEELVSQVKSIGTRPMLFQEFIEVSRGKDIRIQVVGDKVVTAMYRYNINGDFRANVTNGGLMKPYNPTEEEKELALLCCREIGVNFAGVDILFDKDKKPIVCEINSNAHFKNIFNCTGVNVADAMIDYICKEIRG